MKNAPVREFEKIDYAHTMGAVLGLIKVLGRCLSADDATPCQLKLHLPAQAHDPLH
jgi:hypothetical protein